MSKLTTTRSVFIVVALILLISWSALQFYVSLPDIDQERPPAGFAYVDSLATVGVQQESFYYWNFSQEYPFSRNRTFTFTNNSTFGLILPGVAVDFGVTRNINVMCEFWLGKSDTYMETSEQYAIDYLSAAEDVSYSIRVNRISVNMTFFNSNGSKTACNLYTAEKVDYNISVLERKLLFFHDITILVVRYSISEHPTIGFYYTFPDATIAPKFTPLDLENTTIVIRSYWDVVFSQGDAYVKAVSGSLDNIRITLRKINSTAVEINHTLKSFISPKIPIYYRKGCYSQFLVSAFYFSTIVFFFMIVVVILEKILPKEKNMEKSYETPKKQA